MFGIFWLLQRKDGITHDQFREHYERSHVVMAQKYIGHLLVKYTRYYKGETWGGGVPTVDGGNFGPIDWQYDCLTEWVTRSEEDFNQINRIFADPIIGKEFHDDEENFLKRETVLLYKYSTPVETGTGDGHGTLSLTRKIGETA